MRSRLVPILGSAMFLVAAPGTVAGYIPYRLTGWRFGPPLIHHFVLDEPAQIDGRFRSRLREAYAVGRQEAIRPSG